MRVIFLYIFICTRKSFTQSKYLFIMCNTISPTIYLTLKNEISFVLICLPVKSYKILSLNKKMLTVIQSYEFKIKSFFPDFKHPCLKIRIWIRKWFWRKLYIYKNVRKMDINPIFFHKCFVYWYNKTLIWH